MPGAGEEAAGLADYQVRNWPGWHHHQILSLIAAWFLVEETRRKKIWTPALTVPRMADMIGSQFESHCHAHSPDVSHRRSTPWTECIEYARFYYYRKRQLMPPLKNQLRLWRYSKIKVSTRMAV